MYRTKESNRSAYAYNTQTVTVRSPRTPHEHSRQSQCTHGQLAPFPNLKGSHPACRTPGSTAMPYTRRPQTGCLAIPARCAGPAGCETGGACGAYYLGDWCRERRLSFTGKHGRTSTRQPVAVVQPAFTSPPAGYVPLRPAWMVPKPEAVSETACCPVLAAPRWSYWGDCHCAALLRLRAPSTAQRKASFSPALPTIVTHRYEVVYQEGAH